jgi:hypothetical protein
MKALLLIPVALLALSACKSDPPASPVAEESRIPIPVLKVGQPAAIDLLDDGQATITIAAADVSRLDDTSDRVVVTVDILLNKAGRPVTGGPENFRFRDKGSGMHQARTDEQALAPTLPSTSFTASGQAAHGRLFFDVPSGSASGGHIQLMTGALVHAVWIL